MRKTYGPLKAKDCKLGASCGGTCIAQTKSCRIGLKPQEKIKVQAAVKSLKANIPAVKPANIPAVKPANIPAVKPANIPAVKPANSFFKLFKPERILAGDDAKPLGIGAYGIVVLTGGNALKTSRDTVRKGKMLQEVGFQMQAAALGLAPKILAFNNNQILMEKAAGSTVALLKSNGKLKQQALADYQRALRDAIISLHKKGISHNDAHQENIFYDIASKKLTFIDFGLASKAGSFALYTEYRRTMPNAYQQQFKTSKDYVNWLKTQ